MGGMPMRVGLACILLTLLVAVHAREDPFAAGNGSSTGNTGATGDSDVEASFEQPIFSGPQGVADVNVTRLEYMGLGGSFYVANPLPPTGAVNFACSLGYLPEAFRGAYVAMGSAFYNKGFACGQCIRLQCDDEGCEEVGKQMTAMVVDLCGNCFDADLSLAQPLFQNLTGSRGPNALISWEWVPCGELLQGNIKMMQKPGGTAFYQAFSFANSRQPVVAVRINNQLLKHNSGGNWWEWNPGQAINPRGPFKLDLLGNNRQVLSVVINQLRPTDLGVQFRGSEA